MTKEYIVAQIFEDYKLVVSYLKQILESKTKKIAHNGKFDIKFFDTFFSTF